MRNTLSSIKQNIFSKRLKGKYVVIESDDWGNVRIPDHNTYQKLLQTGLDLDKCGYMKYDSLETEDDIYLLQNTLEGIYDSVGKSPILTLNYIVGNPNYDMIRDSGFQEYYYVDFVDSYLTYHGNIGALDAVLDGVGQGFFKPQLHGREHVFVENWLNLLKSGKSDLKIAFENGVFGLSESLSSYSRRSLLTSLDYFSKDEIAFQEKSLIEAQEIFKKYFGYYSKSFIAPNYVYNDTHLGILKSIGVDVIQTGRVQRIPNGETLLKQRRYSGQKSKFDQIFVVRNSSYEPSTRENVDWKKKILKEAEVAFRLGVPLVISSHRVNFMGGINIDNRTRNLKLLNEILIELLFKYPDINFKTSLDVARMYNEN